MTIFIIFSSQKTHGRVAEKSSAVTQIARRRVAHGIARCILLLTFINVLLVYLDAVAQRKES